MNDALSANRLRLALILVISSALAIGSFWLLEVMRKGADDGAPNVQRTEPDYYVEKFNFVRMSTTGKIRYKVVGEKLTHLPADDSYQIEHPVVQSLAQDTPPMVAHADRARVADNRKKIFMLGNVTLDRAASPTSGDFHMSTDNVLVLPDENIIKTDAPVILKMGKSTLSGIGMWASNTTQEFRLLSHVRGTISPRVQ